MDFTGNFSLLSYTGYIVYTVFIAFITYRILDFVFKIEVKFIDKKTGEEK
ncbi:hypothetical protein HOG21_05305 [bacterium]|jgi:hypothetical protein|nr:hypothetical protein [bacterium]